MPGVRKVYYEDSYQQELQAEVTSIDGEWIELDRTIFYPTGGGQPGDTGMFTTPDGRSLQVIDTRKGETIDRIRHQLDTSDHGLSVGDGVDIAIDWDRRYRLMRMHTAMHLLGSLIPVPVTGGAVGVEKSRLDFDLGEHQIDKAHLTKRLQQLVAEAHPVVFESITEAELDEKPELVRTMSVQPPRGYGDIRMVRVVDVDFQPCGGTHVNNSAEVGAVRVSKIENKGKRNRRVNLVFDQPASAAQA